MEESPLGRLPPELRNDIMRRALQHGHPVDIADMHSGLAQQPVVGFVNPSDAALLRVCKQLREECRVVFYAVNTIALHWNGQEDRMQVYNALQQQLGQTRMDVLLHLELDVGRLRVPYGFGSRAAALTGFRVTSNFAFRDTIEQLSTFVRQHPRCRMIMRGCFEQFNGGLPDTNTSLLSFRIDINDLFVSCDRLAQYTGALRAANASGFRGSTLMYIELEVLACGARYGL